MGSAFQTGVSLGYGAETERKEHKRNRQEQLQDEQRNSQLQVYMNLHEQGRIGTPELAHAIEDVYHDAEPEKKMSLLRRAISRGKARKQHEEFLQGRQKSATEQQGIVSGAKQPNQVESEAAAAQAQSGIASGETKVAALKRLIPNATPEDIQAYTAAIFGISGAVKRPTSDENKREDYRVALASGYKGSYEKFLAEQSAEGRVAGSLDKPGLPKAGVAGGKNVFAIETPNGWKSTLDGSILKDFRPAPTYAQVAPSMRAVQVVDPNDPMSTTYESIPEAIRTHAKGTQSIDYKMQMPTAQERGRADLAISAREQLGTMESILTRHPDLFGPGEGHITNFTQWVGSQDPEAQRFKAAARVAADHLAGVFGGRSEAALQGIYDVIGKNITNPDAAIAGLEQMNIAAARIQSRGMGPAPQGGATGGAHKVGEKKKFPNGKTGEWDGQGWVAQ
jgi:hypothetical protein